ncbi:MAG TPA: TonB-dependent receptor [Sandaracinaceae bacterium LLY-WYZ-13_1]|nr:TonB-dependent receptor [Sandaracinaceae bacterium LLY-WYZ-13_1]
MGWRESRSTIARALVLLEGLVTSPALPVVAALVLPLPASPARAQPDAPGGTDGAPEPEEPSAPSLEPPSLIEAPEVTLAPDAAPLPEGAAVLLQLTVDAEGAVTAAEVLEGVREDVDARVLEAARAMRFTPAARAGTPIGARVRFRYRVAPAPDAPDEADEADEAGGPDGDVPPEIAGDDGAAALGVTASVERVEEGAASRITLRAEELTTVPGTFGEPLRAVATLPGVARSPFGLGFFLVRGSDFQNTGFMIDGFVVPLLYHVGAGPSILASRFVERMSFYSGNYPVRFGRFGGGLIDLQTAIPDVDGPLGELSIDAARASVLAIVPTDDGKGAVAASFRRSYFEAIVPLIQPGLDLWFMDYQVLGRYRPTERLELSFVFLGAHDSLDQSGQLGDGGFLSEGSRSAVSFDVHRLITTVRLSLPDGGRVTLSGMVGRDASSFDASQPGFGLLTFAFEAFFAGVRLDTQIPLSDELRTRVGVDVNTLNATILGTAPVPPGLGEQPRPLPSVSTSDARLGVVEAFAAAYLEQVFDFEPLELSTGLRLDILRYGDVLAPVFDPRFVARVRVHPMLTLKAASGLFVQQPSPFTIFRVGGNPSIPPERAWQSSAGLELRFPLGVEAWLTGFYNRFWNIPRGVDEIVPTDDGLRRVFFRADQAGHAWGLEAMVRWRYEKVFYGWVSYTLSRSERWHPGVDPQVFGFDQTHVLNVVGSIAHEGWRFGLRFQLATGRPTRSVLGARFDADTGGFGALRGPADERIPYSHRLDVRIDRSFEAGPVTGSVYLDVINVYFSELPEGRIHQYDYARSGILRGLPIIPSLGVRGTLQ